MNCSRRQFLNQSICAALGGVSLYSGLGNLQLVAAAARATKTFSDYKALVCIYLDGGNDSLNMVMPKAGYYSTYLATRGNQAQGGLALSQDSIIALNSSSTVSTTDAADDGLYGLHPSMSGLAELFNNGHAAIVANTGTLLDPITQSDYRAVGNNGRRIPPQLYAHNEQITYWQTSRPDDDSANGWGGRIADLLYSQNANQQLSMNISLSGINTFERGALVDQYVMNESGVLALRLFRMNSAGTSAFDALRAQGTQAHVLERAHSGAVNTAINNYSIVNDALAQSPAGLTSNFPATNLASQLAMVAKLISVRSNLNMSPGRQIFFVRLSGFDTHNNQLDTHNTILSDLSASLKAFYDATVAMGIANSVTAFTISEFGRNLAHNSDGTDHGWGAHHFVVGGAVAGQRIYGRMPSLLAPALGTNPDDAGYGQIIPTTAVDQYAATLASWYGGNGFPIATVFPNLSRFATPNLGFLS